MAINYTALATGALGLTVALAWNNAVSKVIESVYPRTDEKAAVRATVAYAVVVTIMVAGLVVVINHTRQVLNEFGVRLKAPPKSADPQIVRLWSAYS